ncbi:MAG: hypothetical protein FJ403_13310 [Verrucomicrobia bacterium]|nr:hypothetical protein [Verrucomicrobiota bacterium]
MSKLKKLNLGCGNQIVPGYINVDKFGRPDVRFDLETFPWPWEESSVEEVILNHVLEHLGQTTQIYLSIIQELHRICAPGAKVRIAVPHPRHNDFISDPTHVRAITLEGLALFSKETNRALKQRGCADSPLAEYLNVDFKIVSQDYIIDDIWIEKFKKLQVSEKELEEQFDHAIRSYNNVVKEIRVVLEAVK